MKFRTFFISLLAVLAALTACQQERGNYGIPSIKFGQESLTFTQDGGAAKINVTVTRDWTASTDADWLGIGRTAGTASEKPQEIEISVLPNGEYNRSATVTFVVGKKLITKAFTIYQEGPEGEAPITGPYYEYSLKTAGQGDYTIEDKTLPEGLSAVWTFDSKYGMKATAYAGGTNYASESWLVTPEITLSDTEANYVSFTHAGQYFGKIKEEATFWISEAGTKAQEEWIQLEVPVYPTSWTFVNSGDIDISAYRGKTVRFAFVYKSTASKAGTWEVDALTVSTTRSGEEPGGSDDPTPAEGVIYSDNFDKEAATQTYGSGSSWPYADQFENWQNPKGTGAANVSYEFAGISIRANSPSDGNYSIYAGSGTNNLFFGANNHFQVRNITLGGATNLSLTFGSEKYTQADSKFSKDEFKVYVSNTAEGASWVSLDYDFAQGGLPEGKWDLATAKFSVPSGTSKLYIYITASVASAYRLDDLTLSAADAAGAAVDFSKGVDLGTQGGGADQSEDPEVSQDPAPAGTVYANNFDKEVAKNTYGSGSSWPYLDQFEGWKNEQGSGAGNVSYEFKAMSARANSQSTSQYSLYAGSGSNNLFFGNGAYFFIKNITLDGAQAFALSFGSEKYTQADSKFSKDEFKVYVSNTGSGASWVSLDYTFAAGTMPEGKWDLATSHFTVPQGTQSLYIYVTASVASAYRLDDLTLVSETASATAQSVDFGRGVDLGTQGSTPGGDNSQDPQPQPGNAIVATVADFLAAPESSTQLYQLTGTIGGSINTTYGNFDLTDATGTVYVYGMTATNLGYGATNDKSYASLGLQAGDVITLIGYRGSYTSNSGVKKDEVVYAYFVSKAQGGGDNSQDPSEDVSTDPSEDASVDPVEGMTIPVTVLAEMNQWQDNAQISEFEYQGYTFVIDGSASQTKPIYKINGSTQEEDIRMYANGKITVKAPAGQIMTGIAFTLSGKGLEQTATITASAGTVAAQKKGDTVITWNGQAQEVTFTVGASNDFGSNASKTSGQFCFKQINIQ